MLVPRGAVRVGATAAIVGAVLLFAGCKRSPSESGNRASGRGYEARVPPPPIAPEYSFAEGVREQSPEIAGFLREFLEVCLAGDYSGYRKLASRQREPESRERFQAVYHAIRSLVVESIARIDHAGLMHLSDDVYLVIVSLEFHPESEIRLRRRTDQVAILVIEEEGRWRMLPAPPDLQPQDEPPATAPAPATNSAPSYPWDEQGDF